MNEFKNSMSISLERQKREGETSALIYLPYKRKLTDEEKEQYLSLKEEDLPTNNIVRMLYFMAKKYMQTGEVDEETFRRYMFQPTQEVKLDEVKDEWTKDPRKGGERQ